MGSFMANFKGQKAARLQSKGNYDEARKVYAEAYAAGMNDRSRKNSADYEA